MTHSLKKKVLWYQPLTGSRFMSEAIISQSRQTIAFVKLNALCQSEQYELYSVRGQAYVTVSEDSGPPDTNISAHSALPHSGVYSNIHFFFPVWLDSTDSSSAASVA